MPVCDGFLETAIDMWVERRQSWAQVHVAAPGPDGMGGWCAEVRRELVRWERVGPLEVRSTKELVWPDFDGRPGEAIRISHLSLWSSVEGGRCWSWTPVGALNVPYLATLTVPAGITFTLPSLAA